MANTQNKLWVLQQCTVDGNIVRLPQVTLERKLYLETKTALELIGGKWTSGKTQGFVFKEDPTELLKSLQDGDNRNLQKEYQYFPTPDDIADALVRRAHLEHDDLILEPSAGQGAIVKAIQRYMKKVHNYPSSTVYGYELMPLNQSFLKRIDGFILLGNDFLDTVNSSVYNKIIANPPFSKNQDIDHIRRMYDLLKPGGILVSISSKHWEFSSGKKEREFKAWIEDIECYTEEIDAGSFKESGTMVGSLILQIHK